jgi:1-acyl-sn-glycerol-3-phosphate acyltransferase
MVQKVLIFKPEGKGYFKKSLLYAAPMFLKTFGLSGRYLAHAFVRKIDAKETDDYLAIFWRIHFQESFTTLYVTGKELLSPGETYIFMSNHGSWMDIPAIYGAVPTSLRMVSKEGLMKVPVIGHAMTEAGFVAIDRRNKRKAIKQLNNAKERLSEGISIWIAPEGTRTRDGGIGPFKRGGFYLAKELKKSIVPVFIEGAAEVMGPDSLVIHTNRSITVHFCEPILASEFDGLSISELTEKTRDAIINKRSSVRGGQP